MPRMGGLRSKAVAIALAVMAVAWLAPRAEATISYNLDWIFSGFQPTNPGPWGTISFTTGATDTVNVTMTASNLAASEFISWWGFNSTLDVSGLTVNYSDTDATLKAGSPSLCNSCVGNKADGDGNYDIVLEFTTADNAGRFTNAEVLTFTITGSGLTEANFSPLSTGSDLGAYNTAIHIQGIEPNSCSGWAGNGLNPDGSTNLSRAGTGTGASCASVSEPSTLLFAGLGLAGVVGVSRRFLGRRVK